MQCDVQRCGFEDSARVCTSSGSLESKETVKAAALALAWSQER
jgi:hypothetical protein